MNETAGEPEKTDERSGLPDVTQIPLVMLAFNGDRVLDASIRSVVEDAVSQQEITAGFGNIP